jgi:integrase/recombinase XerD
VEIKAILWTYHKAKDGLFPLKIRIAADNKPAKYVPVGVRIGKGQWTGKKVHESHPNHAGINQLVSEMIKELQADYVNGVASDALGDQAKSRGDFFYYFQRDIDAARARGSHHRADTNASMLNVFKSWRKMWPIKEVTTEALKNLVQFLQERGNSKNTISDKLVRIRTTIENMGGVIKPNPFENFKISFDDTDPKAISDADISLLRQAKFPKRHRRAPVARDLWLFAMNAAGMRWGDVCRLKVVDVANGRIHYRMHKTKKIVDIPQTEEAAAIIARYIKKKSPDDYLFPILSGRYVTGEAIADRIKNENRNYNRSLGYIAKKQGMTMRPRLHDARHTFADMVEDVAAAKSLLAHKSIRSTEIYKKSIRSGTDEILLKALKKKR